MRSALAHLIFWSLLAVASPAWAQDTVRDLNARGLEAFAAGDYVEAAELFGRAYALEPQGELLKNQAVAWYKAERCSDAVESAHQYLLRDDATADERHEIEALLGACKVRLAREAADAGSFELAEKLLDDVEAMNPDPVLRDRVALTRVDIAKMKSAAAHEPSAEPMLVPLDGVERPVDARAETAASADASSSSNKGGWALVSMGSAMLVGGGIYHIVAAAMMQPEFRRTAAAGVDRNRYDELDRSLRTANILVPALYGLGAAVTTMGIVIVAKRPSESGGDHIVMLGVSGTF